MIEIYLNNIDVEDIKNIRQEPDADIEVFIPLDSVGISNSYIDLCDG
ncbi:hypothetical protein [Enterobacter roggenkampii]|nr:hypothetical protein [Enterobacter roggenkampii]